MLTAPWRRVEWFYAALADGFTLEERVANCDPTMEWPSGHSPQCRSSMLARNYS